MSHNVQFPLAIAPALIAPLKVQYRGMDGSTTQYRQTQLRRNGFISVDGITIPNRSIHNGRCPFQSRDNDSVFGTQLCRKSVCFRGVQKRNNPTAQFAWQPRQIAIVAIAIIIVVVAVSTATSMRSGAGRCFRSWGGHAYRTGRGGGSQQTPGTTTKTQQTQELWISAAADDCGST